MPGIVITLDPDAFDWLFSETFGSVRYAIIAKMAQDAAEQLNAAEFLYRALAMQRLDMQKEGDNRLVIGANNANTD